MRGGVLTAICVVLLLFPARALALPEELKEETRTQFAAYDLQLWEDTARSFSAEIQQLWNGEPMQAWMSRYAQGEVAMDPGTVFEKATNILLDAIRQNAALFGALLCIALLGGVLNLVLEDGQGLREIVAFLCYGLAVAGVATFFLKLTTTAQNTLVQLSAFSELAVPMLVAMLSATGSVASAGMLRPLMAFLSGSVSTVFQQGVLPMVQAAALLCIAGNLTEKRELQRLSAMLRSLCKWAIGFVFTVYLGVVSLQGMSVATVDSIGIRTAKYTLDKTLPVVGSAVSGTLDTVRGCAILVKNASGAATVLLTLAYALNPALQIAAAVWTMRLCAAISEPMSDGRIARMLGEVADLCNYLLAVVVVVALMFMIMAGMVIAAGNG